MTVRTCILRLCYLVQLISIASLLVSLERVYAAEYSCGSGDVTCLIASINDANTLPGQHIIKLDPGKYTLQAIDNGEFSNANGLPVIKSSIRIEAIADDVSTVIERDPAAPPFRIFAVSGELILEGITIQGAGGSFNIFDAAISNIGVTSLYNSVVRDSIGEGGAIGNNGTLSIATSIIDDNLVGHEGGGIRNGTVGTATGANVLVENSTIARNFAFGAAGGIGNFGGSVIIKNSAIISNETDGIQPGGGIGNFVGSIEVINTTIARNLAGFAGGGVFNSGSLSLLNSTISENQVFGASSIGGGGIANLGSGTVAVKNTIVAGNRISQSIPSLSAECLGIVKSLGHNVVADPSDCGIDLQSSDLTGDPGLGPLVEMGEDDQPGKTFYPVLPGSVVIKRGDADACPVKDQLGNPRAGTCDIGAIEFQERTQVAIDIRPRSDANKVNPRSNKSINVAILSENRFQATTVDPKLVRFGATGIEAAPVHVASRDVNRDGQRDLVLRFQIQELGVECGATSVTLIGQLLDGQSVIGSAPITTTGCKERRASKP